MNIGRALETLWRRSEFLGVWWWDGAGCGCGNNLVFFAENNCEVYGIDISPTAIKYANELFEKKKLKGFFYTCNLIDHPFEKEYFDLVIDRGCFVHNPKYLDKCIDITYNILKKEGLFFSMLFQKNHSGLKLANKIINNEYYFTDDENYFWYNLQLIILNDNEIKDYYQKFKILEWNLYNIENKINKYIIEYVYLYCQKLK